MNKKYLPLWLIWFALLQGSVIIVFLLSGGIPNLNFSLTASTDLLSFIAFIPIIISLIARIAILPKIDISNAQALLVTTIIGCSLAEGAVIMTLLLNKQLELISSLALISAFIALLSYIPLYLNKSPKTPQNKSFYQQG